MTEVKDTAAKFVNAFNTKDENALNALHADDIKFTAPGGFKATNGKDATKYAMTWLRAFPDSKMSVRSEIVAEPWVVQEVLMEGTHTAPLDAPTGTIAPTYKKVASYGVQILRVKDAKIAEVRIYFDQLDQLTQLGLIPQPARV